MNIPARVKCQIWIR